MAWIDPEPLLRKMLAEIDRLAPGGGLSDGEQAERLTALDAEALQVEREEEVLSGRLTA